VSSKEIEMEFTEITEGESKEMPAKIAIFGVPKIGKSRFAAQFEDAFYINVEDGLSYIGRKVRSTPKLDTYDEVIAWLKHIYENDKFVAGRIVVDSIDWVELLAQARLVKLHNAKSINDSGVKEFAYFKGVSDAASDAMRVLQWLDAIWKKRRIPSLLIAHSQIKTIDVPTQDTYSRYELKLSKALAAKVAEWSDLILFADYSFHVTKDGKTSEPKPMLFAGGSASFVGGGRMKLSREIPLDDNAYNNLKKEIMGK
jgi:hypothetical protein